MRLTPSNTTIITRLLVGRSSRPLRSILSKVDPADLATLVPQLSLAQTRVLFEALVAIDRAAALLLQLSDPQRRETLDRLPREDVATIVKRTPEDETVARIIGVYENEDREYFLSLFDQNRQNRIQILLNYPEGSAGRVMQTQVFSLSSDLTAIEAIEELRRRARLESIYYIYCVDRTSVLEGVVSLRQIVTSSPETPLSAIMRRDIVAVKADQPTKEAATLVSKYGLIAIPVVDSMMRLSGLVTVDDIVDLITEQATAEVYAQAGLQEDDRVYTPYLSSVRKRMPWMLVNLGLAAVASSVVSVFEDTMQILIVLASLKNIVAGVAGNTAIQSLTVVTRGIAVGDFKFTSQSRAIVKEIMVGVTVGLITGVSAGLLTYIWKHDAMVSIVMVISMFLNSLVASLFGTFVPLILDKFKLDPATGSGPIVTMVSDIFSFFSFLGIASLALKMVQ